MGYYEMYPNAKNDLVLDLVVLSLNNFLNRFLKENYGEILYEVDFERMIDYLKNGLDFEDYEYIKKMDWEDIRDHEIIEFTLNDFYKNDGGLSEYKLKDEIWILNSNRVGYNYKSFDINVEQTKRENLIKEDLLIFRRKEYIKYSSEHCDYLCHLIKKSLDYDYEYLKYDYEDLIEAIDKTENQQLLYRATRLLKHLILNKKDFIDDIEIKSSNENLPYFMKLEEQNKIRSVINDLENKLNLLILSKYTNLMMKR